MEAKHTPGPWVLGGTYRDTLVGKDNKQVFFNTTAFAGLNHRTTEHDANTRLAIAAPELLAVLEKVVRYHEYVKRECLWHIEANAQVDLLQMLTETRAAIAKAKGA